MVKIVVLIILLLGSCFATDGNVPYRALTSVSYSEDLTTICLDDGSVWETKDYPSCKEAEIWMNNDPILIYPSKNVFGNEKYSLYNERLRTFSHVDLLVVSNPSFPTFLSFFYLEDKTNIIVIKNALHEPFSFQIPLETELNYESGDGVIIGWNKDIWPGNDLKFPYIIINTDKKTFVKANYLEKI